MFLPGTLLSLRRPLGETCVCPPCWEGRGLWLPAGPC